VYSYLVYESNVLSGSRYIYPSTGADGKIYFSSYYNLVSKTKYSTINGVTYFTLDANLNATTAKAVVANDANYYFNG
jgi:hypothetical protein